MNASSPQPEKTTLTDQLRGLTRGILDPIVSLLARLHVSPDLLTVTGMLLHFLFAWLIASGYMRWAGIAIALIVPMDALDGALARKLGRKPGNFGAFLDSTSDRIAEIILYSGFIIYYYQQDNAWLIIAAYAAVTGSLMVSYTRSRAEAMGLSCKVGLLTRVERYVILVLALLLNRPDIGLIILAVGAYFTVAQRAHHVWKQLRSVE